MFLLDTNVVSELRKASAGRADANVVAWSAATPTAAQFVASVTFLELELGVRRAEVSDPGTGRILRAWLTDDVHPAFEGRTIPADTEVMVDAAGLHVPDPRNFADALIAATGRVYGMTVVTRNVTDFDSVDVLNPWEPLN